MTVTGESYAQGGTARRGATTRASIGAAQTRRNRRDWRQRRSQLTWGGQSWKGRRGRRRHGACRNAACSSYMGKRGLEGATPGNPPTQPPTRWERRAAMGRGRCKGGYKEAGRENMPEKPLECSATTGAVKPPEWPTNPLKWGTRRGAARPPEWQKTHKGPARKWAGDSSCHR